MPLDRVPQAALITGFECTRDGNAGVVAQSVEQLGDALRVLRCGADERAKFTHALVGACHDREYLASVGDAPSRVTWLPARASRVCAGLRRGSVAARVPTQ